ncbi:type II toxin-antitoxin system HipA family toxin [Nocardia sp. NPDC004415]
MAELTIDLYGTPVGTLTGSAPDHDFVITPDAADLRAPGSPILSAAVPLTTTPNRSHRARRQNFFRELLPEGRMRTRTAELAGVGAHDVIGLLRRYGGDLPGAVQIRDPEDTTEPALEPLTTAEVATMLATVEDHPLGNRPPDGRTSLAGVQDKIALARTARGWNRVVGGSPSTHILKPASPTEPTTIYDEEYGARFVRAAGLAEYPTWTTDFDGVPALVVERFDRLADGSRLHQEDFSQALGASGDQKYQRFGGRVTMVRIANCLGDRDALERLLRMTTLAVAVGNLDMHAKNIALLHRPDGSSTLAPAYDFVPQTHQRNDGEMALSVGGEYRHHGITREHLVAEGTSWGLPDAAEIVEATLSTALTTVRAESPHPRAHPTLPEDITRFTTNLLVGRAAGHG